MWPRTSALACVARCSRNTSPNTNIGGRWAPPQKRRRSRRSSVPSLLRAANSDGRIDEGVGVELLTDLLDGRARGVCSTFFSLILINPGLSSSRTVQVHRHHHVRGDLLSLLLRRRRGRRRGGDWPLLRVSPRTPPPRLYPRLYPRSPPPPWTRRTRTRVPWSIACDASGLGRLFGTHTVSSR